MPDSNKAFYVTSVSNGHVLANQANGRPSGVVAENKGQQGDEEKWTMEAGSEPNVVALRSASNGKYLHANGGGCWATVGTGEKQWWRISSDDVTAPGACRFSPVQYPNVYLNHFEGRPVAKGAVGMKVHLWTWVPTRDYWFSWYLIDTETAATFNPLASASNTSDTSKVDFDAKLKALEERENSLAQKDKDLSTEWDRKMKELQDRQASSAKEEEDRASAYNQKLKDLQAREDAVSQQQKSKSPESRSDKASDDQAQRESDLQRKLDALSSGEQKLAADRAAFQKAQSDLHQKEKDLAGRQKEFEESSKAAEGNAPTSGKTTSYEPSSSSDDERLEKTKQENTDLEQRLARLEDQLAGMSTTSAPDTSGSRPPTQMNGKAGNTSSPAAAGSPGCGDKHYKHPRKLNRKVIGLVYQ